MAAFPLAYSVLLSALYLPLILMLAGLVWRGVSFEFRFKAAEAHKPFWDKAFAAGSYVAAFSHALETVWAIGTKATLEAYLAGRL